MGTVTKEEELQMRINVLEEQNKELDFRQETILNLILGRYNKAFERIKEKIKEEIKELE